MALTKLSNNSSVIFSQDSDTEAAIQEAIATGDTYTDEVKSYSELVADSLIGLNNGYESAGERFAKQFNEDEIKFFKQMGIDIYEGAKTFIQEPIETTKDFVIDVATSVKESFTNNAEDRVAEMFGVSWENSTAEQKNQARESRLGDFLTTFEVATVGGILAKKPIVAAGSAAFKKLPKEKQADVIKPVETTMVFDKLVPLDSKSDLPYELEISEDIRKRNLDPINVTGGLSFMEDEYVRGIGTYSPTARALQNFPKTDFQDTIVLPEDLHNTLKNIPEDNAGVLKSIRADEIFTSETLDFFIEKGIMPLEILSDIDAFNSNLEDSLRKKLLKDYYALEGIDRDVDNMTIQTIQDNIKEANIKNKYPSLNKQFRKDFFNLSNVAYSQGISKGLNQFVEKLKKAPYDKKLGGYVVIKDFFDLSKEGVEQYQKQIVIPNKEKYLELLNTDYFKFINSKLNRITTLGLDNTRPSVNFEVDVYGLPSVKANKIDRRGIGYTKSIDAQLEELDKKVLKPEYVTSDGVNQYNHFELAKFPLLSSLYVNKIDASAKYDRVQSQMGEGLSVPFDDYGEIVVRHPFDLSSEDANIRQSYYTRNGANKIKSMIMDVRNLNQKFKKKNPEFDKEDLNDTSSLAIIEQENAYGITLERLKKSTITNLLTGKSLDVMEKTFNKNGKHAATILIGYFTDILRPARYTMTYMNQKIMTDGVVDYAITVGLKNTHDEKVLNEILEDLNAPYDSVSKIEISPSSKITRKGALLSDSIAHLGLEVPTNINELKTTIEYIYKRLDLANKNKKSGRTITLDRDSYHGYGPDHLAHTRFSVSGEDIIIEESQADAMKKFIVAVSDDDSEASKRERKIMGTDQNRYLMQLEAGETPKKLALEEVGTKVQPVRLGEGGHNASKQILEELTTLSKLDTLNDKIRDRQFKNLDENSFVGIGFKNETKVDNRVLREINLAMGEFLIVNKKGNILLDPDFDDPDFYRKELLTANINLYQQKQDRFFNYLEKRLTPEERRKFVDPYAGEYAFDQFLEDNPLEIFIRTKPSQKKLAPVQKKFISEAIEEQPAIPVMKPEELTKKTLTTLILEAKKRGAKRIIMPNLEKIAQARGEEITSVKKGDVELNLNPYKLPMAVIAEALKPIGFSAKSQSSTLNALYQKKITAQDIADIINEAMTNPNLVFDDDGAIKQVGITKFDTFVSDLFGALADLPVSYFNMDGVTITPSLNEMITINKVDLDSEYAHHSFNSLYSSKMNKLNYFKDADGNIIEDITIPPKFRGERAKAHTEYFDKAVEDIVKESKGKVKAEFGTLPYVDNRVTLSQKDLHLAIQSYRYLNLSKSSDKLLRSSPEYVKEYKKQYPNREVSIEEFAKNNIEKVLQKMKEGMIGKVKREKAKVVIIEDILNDIDLERIKVGMAQGGLVA